MCALIFAGSSVVALLPPHAFHVHTWKGGEIPEQSQDTKYKVVQKKKIRLFLLRSSSDCSGPLTSCFTKRPQTLCVSPGRIMALSISVVSWGGGGFKVDLIFFIFQLPLVKGSFWAWFSETCPISETSSPSVLCQHDASSHLLKSFLALHSCSHLCYSVDSFVNTDLVEAYQNSQVFHGSTMLFSSGLPY